ncbi:MAG: hypothetical protein RLY31_421 [Bacteroidota bacterium]
MEGVVVFQDGIELAEDAAVFDGTDGVGSEEVDDGGVVFVDEDDDFGVVCELLDEVFEFSADAGIGGLDAEIPGDLVEEMM